MASPSRLMASGIAAQAASMIGQTGATGLTALGTTKAGAMVIAAAINKFATVATATGLGAILPRAENSTPQVIYNGGAAILAIYARGASGATPAETINALTTGAAFSIAAGKSAVFWPTQAIPGYLATLSA